MQRVRLVHWKPEEAPARAALLTALGYEVDYKVLDGWSIKEFRQNPPGAIVIDLSRQPSRGLELGASLRMSKPTRLIPLIYVEGEPEKVEKVKAVLPDARYTAYPKIGPVLEDVLASPPREVIVPKSLSAPGSPVPLVRKLGIKDGQTIGLINAPDRFENQVPGAVCKRQPKSKVPLTLWFVKGRTELEAALPKMYQRAADGGLWIIWPKKASGLAADLDSNLVRTTCLDTGLVDFKICAVDEVWTGMRFAVRRSG